MRAFATIGRLRAATLLIALVGVLGYAAWREMRAGWKLEDFRPAIETELSARLGREVRIGKLSGDPWKGIRLDEVAVSNTRHGFSLGAMAKARSVRLAYRGRAIWRGLTRPLQGLDRVEIDGLDAELSRDASGRWNFQELLPKPTGKQLDRFLGVVALRDARIHYRDAAFRTRGGSVDVTPAGIDAELDFRDPSFVRFEGSCAGGSVPVSQLRASGQMALSTGAGAVALELTGCDLPWLMTVLPVDPESVQISAGSGTGSASLAWVRGEPLAWAARATVSGGRIRLPRQLRREVGYDGPIELSAGRIGFGGGHVRYGGSEANVEGELLGLGSEGAPVYDVTLTDAVLATDELLAEWPLTLPKEWAPELGRIASRRIHAVGSGDELLLDADATITSASVRGPNGLVATFGPLSTSGLLDGARTPRFDLGFDPTRLELSLGPLFESPSWLLREDTGVLVTGELLARVTLRDGKPRIVATLRKGAGRYLDAAVDDLAVDIAWQDDRIDVTRLSGWFEGARLSGHALVTLGESRPLVVAEGRLDSFDLSRLDRWLKLEGEPPTGFATARFHLDTAEEGAPVTVRGRAWDLGWRGTSVASAVFAARVQGGEIQVPQVTLDDPKGSAVASLRLLPSETAGGPLRIRDGRLSVHHADLRALVPGFEPEGADWPEVGGTAEFAGEVSGDLEHVRASGQLSVAAPSFREWHADALSGMVSWDDGELAGENLALRRGAATANVTGVVRRLGERGAEPEVDLVARVERLSVAEVYALAGESDPGSLSGLVYGETRVRGPLSDLHGEGAIALRDGSSGEFPIREARAEFDFAGADLEIPHATVRLDEGTARASGTVHDWLGSRTLDLEWEVSDVAIAAARQTWAKEWGLAGILGAKGTFSGPLGDFETRAILNATEVELGGQQFRVLEAHVRATRYSETGVTIVDFGPARFEGVGGIIRVAGFWESGGNEININADAAGMRFTSLAELVQRASGDPSLSASLVRAAEAVGGDLYGQIDIDGRPGALTVDLERGRLRGARWQGRDLPEIALSGRWEQPTESLAINELSASVGSGLISGSCLVGLGDQGAVSGTLRIEDVPLDRVATWTGSEARLRGGICAGQFVFSGATRAPVIEGGLRVRELKMGFPRKQGKETSISLPLARLTGLRVSEGAIEVARLDIGGGDPDRDLTLTEAVVPFSWSPVGIVRGGRVRGRLRLPTQEVAEQPLTADLARKYDVQGRIGCDVLVAGTVERPQFSGHLSLTGGHARFIAKDDVLRKLLPGGGIEVTNVSLRAAMSPGEGSDFSRITVSDARADMLGGTVRGSGVVRLADLNPLSPSNRFDVTLAASGLRQRILPGPEGVAELVRGRLELGWSPEAQANEARLSDFLLTVGEGSIAAGGSVVLDPKRPMDELGRNLWHAQCRITDLPVDAKEIGAWMTRTLGDGDESGMLDVGRGRLSGELSLESPKAQAGSPSVLSGRLELHDAALQVPLFLPTGGNAPRWAVERTDVDLAIVLEIGDDVMLPQVKAPLSGGALLVGTPRDPILQGEFRSDGGILSVLGRDWSLSRLGIRFTYEVEPDSRLFLLTANLDARAEARVAYQGQYVRIMLTMQGPLGEAGLELSSDPALSQEEIIGLIGPGGGDGSGEGQGLGDTLDSLQSDLGGALSGLVTNQAIEGLIGQIRKLLGLKKLSLDMAPGASIRGFEVEAEILPNVLLRVREGINSDEDRREVLIGVGYRLPGKATIQAEVTNLGEVRATFEGRWEF